LSGKLLNRLILPPKPVEKAVSGGGDDSTLALSWCKCCEEICLSQEEACAEANAAFMGEVVLLTVSLDVSL
jgi:hypothetical protein